MNTKEKLDLLCNILIVVTIIGAVAVYFNREPDILGSKGSQCFKYFTTDSNLLACLGSILYLGHQFYCRKNARKVVPQWITSLKFVGTVAASITLFTVVLFLAPLSAIKGNGIPTFLMFFRGNVFVLHFFAPVLAIVSCLFLEREDTLPKKLVFFGMLPCVIYSLIYLTMVVFTKKWTDWYGFTFGGQYHIIPVVMIAMYLFTLLLSLAEWKIKARKSVEKLSESVL